MRKEAVIMRTRLCIKPVCQSSRIPASTIGYPVCPFSSAQENNHYVPKETHQTYFGSSFWVTLESDKVSNKQIHANPTQIGSNQHSRTKGQQLLELEYYAKPGLEKLLQSGDEGIIWRYSFYLGSFY